MSETPGIYIEVEAIDRPKVQLSDVKRRSTDGAMTHFGALMTYSAITDGLRHLIRLHKTLLKNQDIVIDLMLGDQPVDRVIVMAELRKEMMDAIDALQRHANYTEDMCKKICLRIDVCSEALRNNIMDKVKEKINDD